MCVLFVERKRKGEHKVGSLIRFGGTGRNGEVKEMNKIYKNFSIKKKHLNIKNRNYYIVKK